MVNPAYRMPGYDNTNTSARASSPTTNNGANGGIRLANYDSQTRPYYAEDSGASNTLRAYPNNFLYSGNFHTDSVYKRGDYGFYWSSTALNFKESYNLYLFGSDTLFLGTDFKVKYYGLSAGCIVDF